MKTKVFSEVLRVSFFFLQQCAAVETTDLLLELLAFLWSESVCFGDQWDDIDFLVQPLHEFDVQRFQSVKISSTSYQSIVYDE